MDSVECIKGRMSIRAFRPEPIPQDLLTDILDTARWSPSYKNTQPWEIMVVSGGKKAALSQMMVNLLEAGEEPSPDLPIPRDWPPAEQARIAHLFKRRCEETGIDLADPGIARKSKIANFNFYRAPHVIYLYQDASLTSWSLFDLGLFAQNLMLAAHSHGVGTVPQAFATDYARQIKEYLSIPATKRLVLGLSVGYPDWEAPINKFRTDRATLTELVTWVE